MAEYYVNWWIDKSDVPDDETVKIINILSNQSREDVKIYKSVD